MTAEIITDSSLITDSYLLINDKSMQITDDLNKLLSIVPDEIRQNLQQHPQRDSLIEIVMDLGRLPEARFPSKAEYL